MWKVGTRSGLRSCLQPEEAVTFTRITAPLKDGENVAINLPFCYLVIR